MKGKRRLQTELADRILDKFGLSVLDLIDALNFYRHPSEHPNPNIFFTDQLALVSPLNCLHAPVELREIRVRMCKPAIR